MTHRISLLLLAAVSALSVAACQGGEEKTSIDAVSEPSPVSETKTEKASAATPTVSASSECGTADPKVWKASVNAQGPERPRLNVSGKVGFTTGGYKAVLQRNGIDLNAKYATLDLVVTPPDPNAKVIQILTEIPVSLTIPDVPREMTKVTITCAGKVLTEIVDIQTFD